MYSFDYNRILNNDRINNSYTDEDFEKIRKSGNTIKINNTVFANGPSMLGNTYLKPHEYEQYLNYLNKINNKDKIKEKENKEKKTITKESKKKNSKKEKESSKDEKIKLNHKKSIKVSDIEKLRKAGATVHINI